jgi:membrane fusion protein (multidrug efflux system)
MDTAFLRTLRSLEDGRRRRSAAGLLTVAALLLVWCGWFFFVSVSKYAVTDRARLEIDRASHPIQSETSGRVRISHLEMGRQVRAGDVLVELDANPEELMAREERARIDALAPQLAAIRAERAVVEQTAARERETTRVALEEARARVREAEATARLAEEEAERFTKLHQRSLVSDRDLSHARSDAQSRRASADSLQLVLARLESEQRIRESHREADRRRLGAIISKLEGDKTIGSATVTRLEYEAGRRLVRAPVSGRIAETQILRPGAFVRDGDVLGAIVPAGALRVVADFAPSAALGRVHPGQPAKLRLQGFPWAEYGTVLATVSAVASEIRDGGVRVELTLAGTGTRVPLQHGLPGTVEVSIERVTPAQLVFRAAGQMVSAVIEPSAGRP